MMFQRPLIRPDDAAVRTDLAQEPVRVFVSYARKDARWLAKDNEHNLIPWLAESLKRQSVVFWHDSELIASDVFTRRIEEEIDRAQISILIVSQSFLNSDFIYTHELPRIRHRAEQGKLAVVPVLVEPCSWDEDDFLSERQMLPGKPTPLIKYIGRDADWAEVKHELRQGIKRLVEKVRAAREQASEVPASRPRVEEAAGTARTSNQERSQSEEQDVGLSVDPGRAHARTGLTSAQAVQERDPARVVEMLGPEPTHRIVELGRGIGLDLVWCPPGRFLMGSALNELGHRDDEVRHNVTLATGFWIGKFPVTQAQWEVLMGDNPSHFKIVGADAPVEQVSWDDSLRFLQAVQSIVATAMPGAQARLPTEAEWEYACRAGTETALNSGKNLTSADGVCAHLDAVGWYAKNSGNSSHRVGQKAPNAWGIFDMHGNVLEWCEDWYGAYPNRDMADPVGPSSGSRRVLRGGSWNRFATYCRSAYRLNLEPTYRVNRIGFRVVVAVR